MAREHMRCPDHASRLGARRELLVGQTRTRDRAARVTVPRAVRSRLGRATHVGGPVLAPAWPIRGGGWSSHPRERAGDVGGLW